MANFTIGVDLGMITDYSALAVVERLVAVRTQPFAQPVRRDDGLIDIDATARGAHELDDHFHARYIKRWDLGTPYKQVIKDTGDIIRRAQLQDAQIILDGTGVGREVCAMFDVAYQRGMLGNNWPYTYVITGGREATKKLVPKRDLVSKMQAILQGERFKVGQFPEARILREELIHFRAKILPSGHESYESARERDHDDIVLAVALACWFTHETTLPRYIDGNRIDEMASPA